MNALATALTIARVNLVRLLRDRTGLFFIFLMPVILIILLGAIYGGRTAPRLGIVTAGAGPLGIDLIDLVRGGEVRLEIRELATETELRSAVEEGTVELGLVVPAGYDDTLRSGGSATVTVYGQPERAMALEQAIVSATDRQSAQVRATRLAEDRAGVTFYQGITMAGAIQAALPGVEVAVEDVGSRIFPADIGPFSLGAQSQLVLFMFLTSMTAATQLILTRQLGVSRRMLASPISVGTTVLGEATGRFAVAMLQGVFIVLLSALVFGVDWGDPVAATLLVVAFGLVGTGTAMVIGVFGNNVDQAGSLGVLVGLMLGALGGAMVPLEVFGEPLKTIARATPHAWALAGFRTLVFDHGGIADILPELAVLTVLGVCLLVVATWRFRRTLVG